MARKAGDRRGLHPGLRPDVAGFKLPRLSPLLVPRTLTLLDDRRTFHPAGPLRPARSFFQRARIVARKPTHPVYPGSGVRFQIPRDVAVCIRRKERREVLIAKRKRRGRGVVGRRNWFSSVSCR